MRVPVSAPRPQPDDDIQLRSGAGLEDVQPANLQADDWQPEDLEDVARSLCAARPGSRVAERLMERAAYLRATRGPFPADRPPTGAQLLL